MKIRLLQKKKWTPILWLVTSLLIMVLVPGLAFADTTGPVFTNVFPKDGALMKSGNLTVSVRVTDPDNIKFTSVTMLVDGNLVSPIKQYGWLDEYTDDYTTMDIYYSARFAEGVHSVLLTVSDSRGNTSTKEWTFSVSQPPQIVPQEPKEDAILSNLRPVIRALATDNTGIDPALVAMYLDGVKVEATFDPVIGEIKFQPEADLADESWHTVTVEAGDLVGSKAEKTWRFFVNTFGEMSFVSDDASCQQCHDRTKHPMNNCGMCHGTNVSNTQPAYPLDDCYKCHYGASTYPASYHNNGLPFKNPPIVHTAQDTDSCMECHGKSWSTGVPPLHNSTSTSAKHVTTSLGCTTCHASTLTREHVNRYDESGQELTCFTCHNSPKESVQQAINQGDTSCEACHNSLNSEGGHPLHTNTLDLACQSCHSNGILTEGQFHQKNGCSTCHSDNAGEIVKYAITTKDTECTACHSAGHNVNLVAKEPLDLPKYPGYEWGVPLSASLMAGESWLPDEFAGIGGKILISSRRNDVTAEELFAWYSNQMVAMGWEKLSGSDAPERYMVMNFGKEGRLATVIIYNGEHRGADAPDVGYRIEILYK